jgi:hypothetical protein
MRGSGKTRHSKRGGKSVECSCNNVIRVYEAARLQEGGKVGTGTSGGGIVRFRIISISISITLAGRFCINKFALSMNKVHYERQCVKARAALRKIGQQQSVKAVPGIIIRIEGVAS